MSESVPTGNRPASHVWTDEEVAEGWIDGPPRREPLAITRLREHLRLFEIGLEPDDAYGFAKAFIAGHRAILDEVGVAGLTEERTKPSIPGIDRPRHFTGDNG